MDSVKVTGVDLEFEVRGSGEPVLLIDMLIADCFVPLLTEPSLAGRYELIRYHKRGWVAAHVPTTGERRRSRRRCCRFARPVTCTTRSRRGALHRRVDRSPTGPRPPREGTHARSAGADAGVAASR